MIKNQIEYFMERTDQRLDRLEDKIDQGIERLSGEINKFQVEKATLSGKLVIIIGVFSSISGIASAFLFHYFSR